MYEMWQAITLGLIVLNLFLLSLVIYLLKQQNSFLLRVFSALSAMGLIRATKETREKTISESIEQNLKIMASSNDEDELINSMAPISEKENKE